jgi:hypothetical protein
MLKYVRAVEITILSWLPDTPRRSAGRHACPQATCSPFHSATRQPVTLEMAKSDAWPLLDDAQNGIYAPSLSPSRCSRCKVYSRLLLLLYLANHSPVRSGPLSLSLSFSFSSTSISLSLSFLLFYPFLPPSLSLGIQFNSPTMLRRCLKPTVGAKPMLPCYYYLPALLLPPPN